MKLVIDTSAFVQALIVNVAYWQTKKMVEIIKLADKGKLELIAPELFVLEVHSVIVQSDISASSKKEHITLFNEFLEDGLVKIIPHSNQLYMDAFAMAETHLPHGQYISIYDAMFHTLAIKENCVFLTDDKKHVQKTADRFGKVVLLEDLEI